jgi:Lon protease-like protein
MAEPITVDFGEPLPVFPLPNAVLLPYAIQPLHIFESRYRQMVEHCLDCNGQLAMASFADEHDATCDKGRPALRPAVCIGQIIHHESMEDGRHNILLHGVCRATLVKVLEPDNDRAYRMGRLQPLEPIDQEPKPMPHIRETLHALLSGPRLRRMRCIETVMQWFDREDVTTHALLELIGFVVVQDQEMRYRLLAEPSPTRRAKLLTGELRSLDQLVSRANGQHHEDWPKGVSWN